MIINTSYNYNHFTGDCTSKCQQSQSIGGFITLPEVTRSRTCEKLTIGICIGGISCSGSTTETKYCHRECCSTDYDKVTEWGTWEPCNCTIDTNKDTQKSVKFKQRSCTNPFLSTCTSSSAQSLFGHNYKGEMALCHGNDLIEIDDCDMDCCASDKWDQLTPGSWGACQCVDPDSRTKAGYFTRKTECSGDLCNTCKEKVEKKECQLSRECCVSTDECCKEGNVNEWSSWKPCVCSVDAILGNTTSTKTKMRKCEKKFDWCTDFPICPGFKLSEESTCDVDCCDSKYWPENDVNKVVTECECVSENSEDKKGYLNELYSCQGDVCQTCSQKRSKMSCVTDDLCCVARNGTWVLTSQTPCHCSGTKNGTYTVYHRCEGAYCGGTCDPNGSSEYDAICDCSDDSRAQLNAVLILLMGLFNLTSSLSLRQT